MVPAPSLRFDDASSSGTMPSQVLQIVPSAAVDELAPLLARAHATESLIQSVRNDPRSFVVSHAKKPILWVLGPVLAALPTFEEDVVDNCHVSPLKAFCLELCILLKHSVPTFLCVDLDFVLVQWLTLSHTSIRKHMQEHSIILAPVVAIGHLSTTSLAATTVSAMISSVTGYGVISGLTGYLTYQ